MTDVQKKCMFCGVDVTQIPRMKDASGRYACKACAEQKMAVAKKSAPGSAAAPSGEGPLDLADIARTIPSSVQNAKACTACGAYVAQNAIICTSCGVNFETGKGVRTRVEASVAPKGKTKSRSSGAGINISATTFAFGIIGVLVAIFAGTFVLPQLVFVLYAASILIWLGYFILLVVSAFQDGHASWGIAAILSIFVPFVGIAVLYYVFAITERASLKILFLAQLVALVLFVAAVALNGTEAFGLGTDSGG
ncbi:MAG: hypothetical protein ACT4PL_03965 [Phycisphaerales bacterium]